VPHTSTHSRSPCVAHMIDRDAAAAIVGAYLSHLRVEDGDDLVLLEKETLERPFGWVFFYNSKRFVDTHDDRYALIGNGPLIVDRLDGSVHLTGTACPLEFFLERYAQTPEQEGGSS
jgi:immunity protein 35 of polymorphic toxin system